MRLWEVKKHADLHFSMWKQKTHWKATSVIQVTDDGAQEDSSSRGQEELSLLQAGRDGLQAGTGK